MIEKSDLNHNKIINNYNKIKKNIYGDNSIAKNKFRWIIKKNIFQASYELSKLYN